MAEADRGRQRLAGSRVGAWREAAALAAARDTKELVIVGRDRKVQLKADCGAGGRAAVLAVRACKSTITANDNRQKTGSEPQPDHLKQSLKFST
jgi:hypothetical protein